MLTRTIVLWDRLPSQRLLEPLRAFENMICIIKRHHHGAATIAALRNDVLRKLAVYLGGEPSSFKPRHRHHYAPLGHRPHRLRLLHVRSLSRSIAMETGRAVLAVSRVRSLERQGNFRPNRNRHSSPDQRREAIQRRKSQRTRVSAVRTHPATPLKTGEIPHLASRLNGFERVMVAEREGLAEREGFEPSRRFPAYTLSRRAPSTTRPPLRAGASYTRADEAIKGGSAAPHATAGAPVR